MIVFFVKSNKKIPTKKGEHSCKCTELSLLRKEGIATRETTSRGQLKQ